MTYQANSDPKKSYRKLDTKFSLRFLATKAKRGNSMENVSVLLIDNEAQHSSEEASVSWL